MFRRAQNVDCITTDMQKITNCQAKCLSSAMDKDNVRKIRYNYWTMSSLRRTMWLMDKITETNIVNRRRYFRIAGGHDICWECFCNLYHINGNFYYNTLKKVKAKMVSPGASGIHFRKRGPKFYTMMNWFQEYVECHGDRMPHQAEVYLPYKTRKKAIYLRYRSEVPEAYSKSAFDQMCKAYFWFVKVKTVSIVFIEIQGSKAFP